MKYNPFKIILWVLFLVFVALNSVRLFIYGFVISFMIVIIDRAFFGTRKRSDTQFLNLFFTFTSIFALFYTFSPYFRSLEFNISHPRWHQLNIISVEKGKTQKVETTLNFLEKEYTPIQIVYLNDLGQNSVINQEIKHYAIVGFEPLLKKATIAKELDFIHQRSLDKLINNKAIYLYQHPLKDRIKLFKGNDAFALRHSIGFQIALILTYILAITLTIYMLINFKKMKLYSKSTNAKELKTVYIILFVLMYSYLTIAIMIMHYLKF